MKKMPVLFVGHGNPMNALDKNSPFNQNFRQTTPKSNPSRKKNPANKMAINTNHRI